MIWWISAILIISWVLGAIVTLKLEAALVGEPTWKNNGFILPLLLWWLAAIYLVNCKHHVNNGLKDEWDY